LNQGKAFASIPESIRDKALPIFPFGQPTTLKDQQHVSDEKTLVGLGFCLG